MPVQIGHSLKNARESRGLSLEDVSKYTGIPAAHLVAIEEGRLQDLPSPFYVRSYLRRFASCVGIQSEAVLHRYRAIERGMIPEQHSFSSSSRTQSRRIERQRGRLEVSRSSQVGSMSPEVERSDGERNDSPVGQMDEELGEPEVTPPARRVTLPPDMPDPQEIGLPPRSSGRSLRDSDVQVKNDPGEREDPVPQRSRRGRSESKEESSSFAIWYTRFLIAGGVLLVLATIGLVIIKWIDDKPAASNSKEGTVQIEEVALHLKWK